MMLSGLLGTLLVISLSGSDTSPISVHQPFGSRNTSPSEMMLFPLPKQAWSHLKASCLHPPVVIAQICCSVLMSHMKVESKDPE